MCVVSMVHDYYAPKFDEKFDRIKALEEANNKVVLDKAVLELQALVAEFHELVEAAKKIDMKTGQPDCVDPEKAKLEERIKSKLPRRRNKVKTGLKAGNYMQLQSPTEIHILDGLGGCDTCFTRS